MQLEKVFVRIVCLLLIPCLVVNAGELFNDQAISVEPGFAGSQELLPESQPKASIIKIAASPIHAAVRAAEKHIQSGSFDDARRILEPLAAGLEKANSPAAIKILVDLLPSEYRETGGEFDPGHVPFFHAYTQHLLNSLHTIAPAKTMASFRQMSAYWTQEPPRLRAPDPLGSLLTSFEVEVIGRTQHGASGQKNIKVTVKGRPTLKRIATAVLDAEGLKWLAPADFNVNVLINGRRVLSSMAEEPPVILPGDGVSLELLEILPVDPQFISIKEILNQWESTKRRRMEPTPEFNERMVPEILGTLQSGRVVRSLHIPWANVLMEYATMAGLPNGKKVEVMLYDAFPWGPMAARLQPLKPGHEDDPVRILEIMSEADMRGKLEAEGILTKPAGQAVSSRFPTLETVRSGDYARVSHLRPTEGKSAEGAKQNLILLGEILAYFNRPDNQHRWVGVSEMLGALQMVKTQTNRQKVVGLINRLIHEKELVRLGGNLSTGGATRAYHYNPTREDFLPHQERFDRIRRGLESEVLDGTPAIPTSRPSEGLPIDLTLAIRKLPDKWWALYDLCELEGRRSMSAIITRLDTLIEVVSEALTVRPADIHQTIDKLVWPAPFPIPYLFTKFRAFWEIKSETAEEIGDRELNEYLAKLSNAFGVPTRFIVEGLFPAPADPGRRPLQNLAENA